MSIDVGKEVVRQYYSLPQSKSYYLGCSTGTSSTYHRPPSIILTFMQGEGRDCLKLRDSPPTSTAS